MASSGTINTIILSNRDSTQSEYDISAKLENLNYSEAHDDVPAVKLKTVIDSKITNTISDVFTSKGLVVEKDNEDYIKYKFTPGHDSDYTYINIPSNGIIQSIQVVVQIPDASTLTTWEDYNIYNISLIDPIRNLSCLYSQGGTPGSQTIESDDCNRAIFRITILINGVSQTIEEFIWSNETINLEIITDIGNIFNVNSRGEVIAKTFIDADNNTLNSKMTKGTDYVTAGQMSGVKIGYRATAEGGANTASGLYTHAEGQMTVASGQGAHTEGYGSKATNQHSHAEGYYTQTGAQYQHVGGKYNIGKNNTLFEIGNGTADNARSNAFEVYNNGDITVTGSIYDQYNAPLFKVYETWVEREEDEETGNLESLRSFYGNVYDTCKDIIQYEHGHILYLLIKNKKFYVTYNYNKLLRFINIDSSNIVGPTVSTKRSYIIFDEDYVAQPCDWFDYTESITYGSNNVTISNQNSRQEDDSITNIGICYMVN